MVLKKESHVFSSSNAATSEEPDTIEKTLSAQGIDFHSYNRKNSFRIYHIESPDNDNNNEIDILDTLKTIRKEATRDMKPPYRFVGRTLSDAETIEGMKWDWLWKKQVTTILKISIVHKCVIIIFLKLKKAIGMNG
jgi:hypothetical protein